MTKSDVLPPDLQELLVAIGERLNSGQSVEAQLPSAVAGISALPATTISQSAPAIATAAKLYRWRPEPAWPGRLFRPHLSDKQQLLKFPDLRYLFLFHCNGRMREVALKRITGGLQSSFLFAAIAIRLNDWAEPVRAAAFDCAKRCFPLTSAEVIANAVTSLLLHQESWGRWGVEREAMETTLARPDVAEQLSGILCEAQTGPTSRTFRLVLKNSSIDPHLSRLAASAKQPWIRAMAVKAIADERAGWQVGWEWKWIDKSMGKRAREPKFDFRDVQISFDKAAVIRAAASDTSAIVRRAALTAVIQQWRGSREAEELALRLRADPNPSVRERAAFILSRTGESVTPA
ncbi:MULTISPECIES: hypothetical protein [unclassified Rhizobium]|uniref:hypothetical protein n=1 Tax=unclassified Rhizobium TaxID=2613769 RepID=UPI0014918094|nr:MULTISPECIES: hypothetical protein [unclassified Rhizobium]NNU66775.1 hypothetical protein [Rhizobium sp. WYCCWR 11152]NYT34590.1 hypothetical protein [Rhizobium sp. WYCCWR 11128]